MHEHGFLTTFVCSDVSETINFWVKCLGDSRWSSDAVRSRHDPVGGDEGGAARVAAIDLQAPLPGELVGPRGGSVNHMLVYLRVLLSNCNERHK